MSAAHDEVAAERDRPQNLLIAAAAVFTFVVTIGLILAVNQYFKLTLEAEREKKIYSVGGEQIRKLRAYEDARLSSYQWIDRKTGVVPIPVQRAVELVLAERRASEPRQ